MAAEIIFEKETTFNVQRRAELRPRRQRDEAVHRGRRQGHLCLRRLLPQRRPPQHLRRLRRDARDDWQQPQVFRHGGCF